MTPEKLAEENHNLIYLAINRLHLLPEIDNYYDLTAIGLMKGCNSYDPSKGFQESTYLYRCIVNEILYYKRVQSLPKRNNFLDISLDETYNIDGTKDVPLYELIPDKYNLEDDYQHKEDVKLLYESISKLSDKERYIITSFYGIGTSRLNQKQLSAELGVSQAQVSRYIKNIHKKLTSIMNNS
jgi:RNA polymerase sporulation-specific sigma factor